LDYLEKKDYNYSITDSPPLLVIQQYSLRDFHTLFYERYKEHHPSLLLVKYCYTHFEKFIEHLENFYGDEEFMDEEILSAIYENPFQNQEQKLEHNRYEDEFD
jgi:hypothetical protein